MVLYNLHINFSFLIFYSGLKDENKKLHGQIKEQELAAESEKLLTNRLKQSLERVRPLDNNEVSDEVSVTFFLIFFPLEIQVHLIFQK